MEHETIHYLDRALEKAKKIVMTFEDPTKAVTHDKHENDNTRENCTSSSKLLNQYCFVWSKRFHSKPLGAIKLHRKLSLKIV